MRFVIQVCDSGSVSIDSKVVSSIKKGEVVLVSFTPSDNEKIVDRMIDKLVKLRIFPDEKGMTNLSIDKVNGEFLCVSQFTLYASLNEGNRPAFINCMKPDEARKLYGYFCEKMSAKYSKVQYGVFQADMKVSLVNDGPFTVILDSKELGYGD